MPSTGALVLPRLLKWRAIAAAQLLARGSGSRGSHLDAETSRSVVELIKEVSLRGTTVVVATHDEALDDVACSVPRVVDGPITVSKRS
jgi:ABC-type ATPase involved in cell division